MNELDGDADLEPAGDEDDTGNAEDELLTGQLWGTAGPGCPISDNDICVDDDGEDERASDC